MTETPPGTPLAIVCALVLLAPLCAPVAAAGPAPPAAVGESAVGAVVVGEADAPDDGGLLSNATDDGDGTEDGTRTDANATTGETNGTTEGSLIGGTTDGGASVSLDVGGLSANATLSGGTNDSDGTDAGVAVDGTVNASGTAVEADATVNDSGIAAGADATVNDSGIAADADVRANGTGLTVGVDANVSTAVATGTHRRSVGTATVAEGPRPADGATVAATPGASAGDPPSGDATATPAGGDGDSDGGDGLPTAPTAAVGAAAVASGAAAVRRGLVTVSHGPSPAGLTDALAAGVDWLRVHLPRAPVPFGYSRHDDSDPLEHEVRAALYDRVEADPSVHLSALAGGVDVSLSSVRHHLRILEEESLIEGRKIRGKRRYFPAGAIDPELVAALDDPATASVLRTLAGVEPATVSDLAERLGRDPSTISHHLSGLADDGLVERERAGQAVENRLADRTRAVLATEVETPAPAVAD